MTFPQISITLQRNKRTIAIFCLGAALLMLISHPLNAQERTDEIDQQRPWAAEADAFLRDGDVKKAELAYRDLLQSHPSDSGLWIRIAVANLQLKRPGAALEAARSAIELDPDSTDPVLILAQCQSATGQYRLAMTTLENGLLKFPSDVLLQESLVSLAIGLEEWTVATGMLRELIRLHPNNVIYQFDLGRILLSNGNPVQAIEIFQQARALNKDTSLSLALEGKANLALGKFKESIEFFELSMQKEINADALGGLATIHFLRGEKGKAITRFREALRYSSNDADLHYNLANVLAQSERFDEAEASFRRSLELNPNSASTHTNLGVLLLNRFAVQEANDHLVRAIELDPKLAGPNLHMGRISGSTYRYPKAVEYYSRYQELVEDKSEKQRIAGVLQDLDGRVRETEAAYSRGEIHLLQMRLEGQAQAESIRRRVLLGEDFYAIAQNETMTTSLTSIDAGFMHPTSLGPAFQTEVATLAKGDVSAVLKAGSAFYLFLRVE